MEVTLFSTNCPKCNVLEKKLNIYGIDYKLVTDVDEMAKRGFMSAPMLEVDGKVMNFIEAVKWVNGGSDED